MLIFSVIRSLGLPLEAGGPDISPEEEQDVPLLPRGSHEGRVLVVAGHLVHWNHKVLVKGPGEGEETSV